MQAGGNILGRDLSADIAIDAVGVSRRHAAIDVGDRPHLQAIDTYARTRIYSLRAKKFAHWRFTSLMDS